MQLDALSCRPQHPPTSWMRLTCTSSMAFLGSCKPVSCSIRSMLLTLACCFTSCQRFWNAGSSACFRSSCGSQKDRWRKEARSGTTGSAAGNHSVAHPVRLRVHC